MFRAGSSLGNSGNLLRFKNVFISLVFLKCSQNRTWPTVFFFLEWRHHSIALGFLLCGEDSLVLGGCRCFALGLTSVFSLSLVLSCWRGTNIIKTPCLFDSAFADLTTWIWSSHVIYKFGVGLLLLHCSSFSRVSHMRGKLYQLAHSFLYLMVLGHQEHILLASVVELSLTWIL